MGVGNDFSAWLYWILSKYFCFLCVFFFKENTGNNYVQNH